MAKARSASSPVTTKTKRVAGEAAPKGAKTKDRERGVWEWTEREEGKVWMSGLIPAGDFCCATVKRSFSKDKDKWWYYAYRDGKILGKRDTPERAMQLAESGKHDDKKDMVSAYVTDHAGDIPMFLVLTRAERESVSTFHRAAPRPSEVAQFEALSKQRRGTGGVSAADMSDPSTLKLLREIEEQVKSNRVLDDGTKPARGAGSSSTTKAERAAVDLPEAGVMSRVREGNPKKEGSAAWRRWNLMFEHCAKNSTVKEFLAKGGNPETLKNACLKGWAKVEVK